MTEDLSVLTRPAPAPDATIAYGDDADQIADVRYGKGSVGQRPLVLIIHGGFWRPIYDRTHTGPMAAAIAAAGWTAASIEYRRTPGDPDTTLHDVSLAVERLAARVGRHNGRVVLLGHSAGGHLALCADAMSTSRRLIGVLALAPVADLRLAEQLNLGDGAVSKFLGAPAQSRPDIDPKLLPEPAAEVTIMHGDLDDTVALEISHSYAATHLKARLIALQGVAHFAVIDPLSSTWPQVVEELQRLSS